MNATLDLAKDRFQQQLDNDEDEAKLLRGKLVAFRNLYAFSSQVIPYQDSVLQKLYSYLRHLAPKLSKRRSGPQYTFDDDVRLEYYRLQKISEGSISLNTGLANPLDGLSEVGSGVVREEQIPLSRLIDVLNERYGTDFNEADQLFFDHWWESRLAKVSLSLRVGLAPMQSIMRILFPRK